MIPQVSTTVQKNKILKIHVMFLDLKYCNSIPNMTCHAGSIGLYFHVRCL